MKIYRSFSNGEIPEALSAVAHDENLTYGARGLLIRMLCEGEEWDASTLSLAQSAKGVRGAAGEGRDAMRSLMEELKAKGYIHLRRQRAGGGRFGSYLEVFDVAQEALSAARTQRRVRELRGDVVYVIGEKGSPIVKIGTTNNLSRRLKAIQTGSPVRLSVRWKHPGGWRLEDSLHCTFKALQMEGEWFDFGDSDPVAEVSQAAERFSAIEGADSA